jgi:hypothetical protein
MEYRFKNKQEFMEKLEEFLKKGYTKNQLSFVIPNPDHDIEHLVEHYWKPSKLKFFTLAGGLTGCLTGFVFTTWTALDWKLVTGGKPFFSIPAYTVIAFELTILLGALASFAGLLILGRLPRFSKMLNPDDYGNEFVIILNEDK